MEKSKLRAIAAQDVDYVAEHYIGRKEISGWLFIGHTDDGKQFIYVVAPRGEEHKEVLAAMLRERFREDKVTAYSAITETWYLSQNAPTLKAAQSFIKSLPPHLRRAAAEKLNILPSEHPDERREGINVTVASATYGISRMLTIERDAKGKIARFVNDPDVEPFEGEIPREFSGRFATLLVKDD